ncbi:hypothetical protein G7054_g13682 [Neopestalotiopsis clavispora]|nr:hypothetical protein G7054_g13682 [Neopestalotiopsis clavispora]
MWIRTDTYVRRGSLIQSLCMSWLAVVQAFNSSTPLPPSKDPFYVPPSGFETLAPGTVLRIRTDPSNITSVVNASTAYNILYRSTDAQYQPSWAVTTLLVPDTSLIPANSTSRLLSYQIPYNSADVDASPSHLLSTLYATAADPSPADYVAEALSRGWYVSVPDFEGPNAAFFTGPRQGHAVLDATRAILSQSQLAKWDDARYVMWGYSGGALASYFAAELQASYAPELSFAGAAIGGLPSNLTSIIYNFNNGAGAGTVVSLLLGLTADFPAARDVLVSNLKTVGPFNATSFLACLHYNAVEFTTAYAGQDIFEYFVNGSDILTTPAIARVIGNNALPTYHGVPQMPIFAYHGINDENCNIEYADVQIQRYCEADADILYQRNTVGGHEAESVAVAPLALEWLARCLEGNADQTIVGCTIRTVTIDSPPA